MDQEAELSAVTETLGLETPVNVNGLDGSADSSFHPYLSPGSYLDKDDSSSTPGVPIMSYSESNRDGVLSALQSLQEKMKLLEVERRAAESSLQSLASETQLYKSSLHEPLFLQRPAPSGPDNTHPAQEEEEEEEEEEEKEREKEKEEEAERESSHFQLCNGRPHQKQMESQLSTAETRCLLLEKQLEYMRQLVHGTERQRTHAVHKAEVLQQEQQQQQHHHHHHHQQQRQQQPPPRQHAPESLSPVSGGLQDQLQYIGELEKDRLHLTVSQTLAESRIKALEARLQEERRQRNVPQEKTSDEEPLNRQQWERSAVPSQAVPSTVVSSPPPPPPSSSQQRKKRGSNGKKKKKRTVTTRKAAPARTETSNKHYRLNLADIPFVAGKSTAPSHAVGANVQKVLAMMKSHNMALCSSTNGHHHHHHHHHPHGGCNGEMVAGRLRSSLPHQSPSLPLPVDLDLADVLGQLQDEFGQLSLEHQEYLQAFQETTDARIHHDLQRELDTLLVRMELKSQQIAKVKQHQQRLEDARRASKRGSSMKKSESVPRPTSAQGRLQTNHKHPNPNINGNIRPKSSARNDRDLKLKEPTPASLNVLRDMRKLQTTLRRDDLCWE